MADVEWTEDELRASVAAYLEMLRLWREGKPYVKKQYYRDLAARFDRTEKAFEYRAQNISHVLALLGREWLPGLVPARNVGSNVVEHIEALLADLERTPNSGAAVQASRIRAARRGKRGAEPPVGNRTPGRTKGAVTAYARSPEVCAWVLDQAEGRCELCDCAAPFVTHVGDPFLEVHHVRRLADGGSDTVHNAVALCPNCHRALHFSGERHTLLDKLYGKLQRLVRE